MKELNLKKITICFTLLAVVLACQAKTWQLDENLDLKEITEARSGFELAFAEMKKATDLNEADKMMVLASEMEAEYPDIASGKAWQAYIEAEKALAEGKWKKSSELFTAFLDDYPVSRFYNAALEREYDIASAFLSGQKRRAFGIFMIKGYDDGEVMMRKIADKAGNSGIAQRALITLAQSYEQRELYLEAYDVWTEIAVRWPTGRSGEQSLLGMARAMHSAYNGPNYDGSPLKSAEGYYGQYKLRYPEAAEDKGVNEQLENTAEQLAYKYLSIADYYARTGDVQSALIYYNYILDNRGDTKVAEMAAGRIEELEQRPKNVVIVKPEDKSLLWRLWHFFDFEVVEEGSTDA
jgi:outer membrane protein assembly factor BamD (BamD/ComL family)